jgi:CubicO group peptidase (beta-lactamase class C family)
MKAPELALLSALLLAQVPGWACAQGQVATQAVSRQKQVDALFAKWNRPDAPGAAVEVVKDGKVVYRRAFGMADIEQGRPITPSTAFHVASLSKQFTAFAVLLLAQDGKLSLDDDVRHYMPELPDFGQTIRIRHLLNHTSGLRDQWNLLAMAGWRMDDVIQGEDVMGLVRRQRALNFAPGSEFEYSNTGYTLLGEIVQRVSGKSLAAFSKERIFDPLGMKHTFFHEQYATLVAGRAQSYQPAPGAGYDGVALSYSTVGPSSLFTTADDLVLWDRNFDDARVGGKPLLARMQTPATLNDGTVIDYGDGVFVGNYRGLRSIDHSGADAGFRSYLLRFPDQHLTVVIAGNGADVQATRLGERIADIYLDGQLDALTTPVPDYANSTEVPLDPARLDALVGTYALENGSAITFAKEQGHLVGWTAGDDKMRFYPAGEREFFVKLANARFTFDPPGADGVIAGGTWRRNTRTKRATRIAPAKLTDSDLKAIEGEYYSDELHVLYTVTAKNGSVVLSYSRGDIALAPFAKDSYVGPWPFGLVNFQCAPQTGCTGFTATEDRARDVQFTKVAVVGAGASIKGATGVFLLPSPPRSN